MIPAKGKAYYKDDLKDVIFVMAPQLKELWEEGVVKFVTFSDGQWPKIIIDTQKLSCSSTAEKIVESVFLSAIKIEEEAKDEEDHPWSDCKSWYISLEDKEPWRLANEFNAEDMSDGDSELTRREYLALLMRELRRVMALKKVKKKLRYITITME